MEALDTKRPWYVSALAVSIAINLFVFGAPGLVFAVRMRSDLDAIRDNGSAALSKHVEHDARQDVAISTMQKEVQLRGAQLDRIEQHQIEILKLLRH